MAAMQGQPLTPYTIIEQLRQLYEVRTLSPDFDKVDDDVDVLMIAQPQNLSEKTLYAIDQFVLKGGKALVFVDPYSETQAAHANRMNPSPAGTASNLDKLFAAWGIDMAPGKIAGDRRAARRVNAGAASRVQPIDYVAWLALKEDNLNHDNLDHRRSVADQHGDRRHPDAARRRQDHIHAAHHHLAKIRRRSRSRRSRACPMSPGCSAISNPTARS